MQQRQPAGQGEKLKLDRRNLAEMFDARVASSGDQVALRRKVGGHWEGTTWRQWRDRAREVAAGLMALGAAKGDRIAILANSRLEWLLTDIGGLIAGLAVVPIYQSNTPDQTAYIIENSGSRYVVAEDPGQLEKLFHADVQGRLAGVHKIIYFDAALKHEKADKKGRLEVKISDVVPKEAEGLLLSFDDLCAQGRTLLATRSDEVDARAKEPTADDLFTLVYTSGTTGNPKGVMLTHGNMLAECQMVNDLLPVKEDDEQLLFLPLAHIFARVLEFVAIRRGFKTSFAESIPKLVDNLGEVHPTFMGSVPRIYEKVYAKVQGGAAEGGALKKGIFDWAVSVGKQHGAARQAGREPGLLLDLQYKLADKLVFSKLKARMGGRVRFFVSGGAPLAREIAEFFHAAGLLILEGYGLTETAAATHINRPDRYRFGTVGPAIPGVEVKFAEDGEILVRGPNIMKGYYKLDEATREVLDPDGWFHTGDIGVDEDGFLKITDRKKDLIKTSGGKYVAPQNLENALKGARYISQAMIHGDNRKFVTALITLDEENLRSFAKEKNLSGEYAQLTQTPEVRELVQGIVNEVNSKCASFEAIKKFAILDKDFTQETGELTPTLKVKRKVVTEKYRSVLDGFYG